MSSSSSSSSFLKASVDDLSTDEMIVSSASESEVEDEVFLPNDYQFDGSDPMVIPPPIQQVPSSSSSAGVMVLAAAAAAVSGGGGGDGASVGGGESPLAWPFTESPAASGDGAVVVKSAPTIPTATPTSVAGTWPTWKVNGKTFAVLVPPMEGSWPLWEEYTGANAAVNSPIPPASPMSSSPPVTVGEDYDAVVNYAATMPTATTTMAAPGEDVATVTIPTERFNYTGMMGTPVITPENGRIYAIRPVMISAANVLLWSREASPIASPSPSRGGCPIPVRLTTAADAPVSPTEIASPSPRGPPFSPISPPPPPSEHSGSYTAGMWLSLYYVVCLSV